MASQKAVVNFHSGLLATKKFIFSSDEGEVRPSLPQKRPFVDISPSNPATDLNTG